MHKYHLKDDFQVSIKIKKVINSSSHYQKTNKDYPKKDAWKQRNIFEDKKEKKLKYGLE